MLSIDQHDKVVVYQFVDQFERIHDVEKMIDMSNSTKDTKIGHRINFFPTKSDELKDVLEGLLTEKNVRKELAAVLAELLRCGGIS